MKDIIQNVLKSRIFLVALAVIVSYAATGFTDLGKAMACIPQPEQCLADAVKKVSSSPSDAVAEAVKEKAPEVELLKVKTIDGNIVQTVPTADPK